MCRKDFKLNKLFLNRCIIIHMYTVVFSFVGNKQSTVPIAITWQIEASKNKDIIYLHVVQYLVNAACGSTWIPISKVRHLYRPCGHSIYYNEPMFLWDFFDAGALHLFGPCSELEAFGMGSGSVDGNPRFLISTAVNPDLSGWGTVVSSVSFDSRESLLSLLLSAFLCL